MAQPWLGVETDLDDDDLTIPLRVRRARAAERARAEAAAQRAAAKQQRRPANRPIDPFQPIAPHRTRQRGFASLPRHVPVLGVVVVAIAASLLGARLPLFLDQGPTSADSNPRIALLDPSILRLRANVPTVVPTSAAETAAAIARAATAVAAADPPRRSEPVSYTVKPGDSIASIAAEYGLDIDTLVNTNRLRENPDLISPGQQILILPVVGALHKVQSGETLRQIATAYGVDVKVIVDLNHVTDADLLALGQEIIIPGAKQSLDLQIDHSDLTGAPGASDSALVRAPGGPDEEARALTAVSTIRPRDADPLDFAWPISGPITTQFREAGTGYSAFGHTGIDIANDEGATIRAAEWGKVVTAVKLKNSYGWYIVLEHRGGYQSLYGHMSKFLVGLGDEVAKGQPIGLVGNTGYSFGDHLHFEIRRDGGFLNPRRFLN